MAGDTKSSSTATGLSSATSNRALLPPDRASLRICLSPSSRWYRHANKGRTAVRGRDDPLPSNRQQQGVRTRRPRPSGPTLAELRVHGHQAAPPP